MYRLKLKLHGTEVSELQLEPGREYVFGRGSNCDVVLEGQPGISRAHFRIAEDNGQWTVQVLSKFGDLTFGGQPVQHLVLEPGHVFKLAGYDFNFLEPASQEEYHEEEAPMAVAVGQSESLPAIIEHPVSSVPSPRPVDDFAGNDEATRVVANIGGVPHLRIVDPSGEEETIKLEGKKWVAGRDGGSEILLNDRKASRRQFDLSSAPQGYFIRDLGSSNGTLLNGSPLAADELKPLRSGDVISVGALAIHFEVRDPNFEKKLMVIPAEVLASPPAIIENPYEMINYPVPSGPGGAIRVGSPDGVAHYEQPWGFDPSNDLAKKKKVRFYMIVAAILLPVLALVVTSGESDKPKQTVQATDPFSKLSPQKQQVVKETYILAKNLLMQGKYSLAADQLKKLHDILPEGYEASLSIAAECKAQAEQEEQLKFYKAEQEKQAENRRIVDRNLHECEALAATSMDPEQVRSCLTPTFELDPSNPRIDPMLQQVQKRLDDRNMKLAQQRDYQDRVGRGRAMFANAEVFDKQGRVFEAVEAYRKHIASPLPDPENLKSRSQARVIALTKQVSARVEAAVAAAESAYASQNYKEAIEQIKRAKDLDASNEPAAELNAKIRRELAVKLKEIYEESIIAEGIGNIPQAKELWKKILDTDHPEGEYYRKAKSKMRSYGAF